MEITITVPLNEKALREAATQLEKLAETLRPSMIADLVETFVDVGKGTVPATSPAPVSAAVPSPPLATPPAPVTPPAPATPMAATPPPPPAAVELDTEGLPWDERIHSSTKSKYAKSNAQTGTVMGGWKRKRGVQPLTVDNVKAELRLIYPAPPMAPVAPVAPPTAPVTPPVSPDGNLYLPLMQKCTERINANELTLEAIVAVCNKHGVNTVPELAARSDLIPTVEAEIEAIWIRNTTTQG